MHRPDGAGVIGRLQGWRASLAVYWDRRLFFVFILGLASGLPFSLSGATLSVWLTEAGVSLTEIGFFALVGVPYNLKFFWAPLIDGVRIPLLTRRLGRRRSWMMVVQLGLMASIVALGLSEPEVAPLRTAFCALAVAFFSASQDIVIDAYRIDLLDHEQQGAGAAVTQAGYRLGMVLSGAGALYLASSIPWPVVYVSMGALILIGFVAAWRAPVPEGDEASRRGGASGGLGEWFRRTVVGPFLEFFRRNPPHLAVAILAFILLYKLGDSFAGVMANPFYIRIGFTKLQIAGVSKVFGVVATLLGVFVGGVIVKRLGILVSLFVCGLFQMFSNLMFAAQAALGANIGFLFLTIGVENLSAGMGSAAFVAYLSVLCNASYTGTQYALFTSLMAFGRIWLSAGSGWVADHTDWVRFFILSTVVAAPGMVMLVWMMRFLPLHRHVADGRKEV